MALVPDAFETNTSGAKTKSYKDGATQQTLEFIVTGFDMADDVEAVLNGEAVGIAGAPLLTGTNPVLRRDSIAVSPISTDVWQGTVNYTSDTGDTSNGQSWTFSGTTSGGSTKVTQGIAVQTYARSGTTAINYNGAINASESGVEGVDIAIPALEFTISKRQDAGVVTVAFVAQLMKSTGTTNNAQFNQFARGELLFMGADFSQSSTGETEVSYKFVASPNKTGLNIGGITGVAKKGHEYLWVAYEPTVDSSNRVTRRPATVYVHQVYEESNFALLQIL